MKDEIRNNSTFGVPRVEKWDTLLIQFCNFNSENKDFYPKIFSSFILHPLK
jgi:Fic family protein